MRKRDIYASVRVRLFWEPAPDPVSSHLHTSSLAPSLYSSHLHLTSIYAPLAYHYYCPVRYWVLGIKWGEGIAADLWGACSSGVLQIKKQFLQKTIGAKIELNIE